jgi:hypothetical protein
MPVGSPGMIRALAILVLVIGGATALAWGMDIRQQLAAQLDAGFSGAVRSFFVAISVQNREQVAWYRWLSVALMSGGAALLGLGLLLGATGRQGPAAKGTGTRKERRRR